MTFIVGIILLIIGFSFIVRTEWLVNNIGRIAFFEQKLGTSGGTRLGYKLMGILIIFIGFLCVTGMFDGFMEWIVSPLTQYTIE